MAKAGLQILYTGSPYEILSFGRQTVPQMGAFVVTWPIFTARRHASVVLAVVVCLSVFAWTHWRSLQCKRHFPLRSEKIFCGWSTAPSPVGKPPSTPNILTHKKLDVPHECKSRPTFVGQQCRPTFVCRVFPTLK